MGKGSGFMITGTIRDARYVLRRWVLDPRIQQAARMTGYVLAGFCLSAAALEQRWLPLAVGLVWACTGAGALLAALGGAAGYWFFWGQAGLQGILCTLGALAGSLALGQRRISREVPLLIPSLGMLLVSAAGLGFQIFAADTTPVLLYLIRVALGGAAPWLFRGARENRDPWLRWAAWGLSVLALAQLAPVAWLGLGFVAVGAAAAGGSFPCAAVTGLAIDLAAVTSVPLTAVSVLVWLLRLLPGLPRGVRILSPALMGVLVMRLLGRWDIAILPGLVLGGFLGTCLYGRGRTVPPRGHTGAAQVKLEMAAGMLERIGQLLPERERPGVDVDALAERAVRDACAGCAARKTCRETETLCRLPGRVLREPLLDAGALPVTCRKSGRVLQELRRAQLRLRSLEAERRQQEEYRRALLQQYRFLGTYLRSLSDRLARREPVRPLVYGPQVRVWGNRPQGNNGDRCLHFSGVGGYYYVLLCDGMGTGEGAVQEGNTVGELLKQMLLCGFPAEHALQSLNSFCVLTDRSGSATVDLAELSLETGKATLYKWGAAPSWHLSRRGVEKLGGTGMLPGVSPEAETVAPCRFSLGAEQLLLMVSDGVPQEEVLRVCREWDGISPSRMAERLLSGKDLCDDATVIAIQLLPVKS